MTIVNLLYFCLFFFLIFEPHLVMLRSYNYLAVLGGLYGIRWIEPGLTAGKANVLPTVPTLAPLIYILEVSIGKPRKIPALVFPCMGD